MFRKEKKTLKSLIIVLIFTYLMLAAFIGGFVFFTLSAQNTSDADINGGFISMFKYHFSQVPNLLTFKFASHAGVISYIISGMFYFFAFIALLYLVVGIIVCAKKKRALPVWAMVASFLVPFLYLMGATGASKYWAALSGKEPFGANALLIIPVILLILSGVAFTVLSYIAYFASLAAVLRKPAVAQDGVEEKAEKAYQEEPVAFEEIEDPGMMYEPLPEPPAAEQPKEEKTEEKDDLKSLLREVVRDIVRDEIARNNANQSRSDFNPMGGGTVTGATFGGPLVVQYFNGGINSPNPQPAPQPEQKPEPQPAPVEEEKQPEPEPVEEQPVEEPAPEPAPKEEEMIPEESPVPEVQVEEAVEPVEESAPVEEVTPEPEPVVEEQPVPVEEVPVEQPKEEKKPIIRIPFTERMINADEEMQNNYNELKNEILSYGVNSRVSNSGDTFRLHRVTYIKITIAGLSLKLYFALNPEDYKDSTLPIQNAGHKGIYSEIPLVFKVKSGLSMRRCKQLIQDVFDKNGLEQGEIKQINWVEELKNAPQDEAGEED